MFDRVYLLIFSLISCIFLGCSLAEPFKENSSKPSKSKLAIRGYDPVAYFTLAMATRGKKQHCYQYQGRTWRFANVDHLALFKAAPAQYMPQYAGYCAYGVATGGRYCASPQQWEVFEGKLYLFFPTSIFRRKWQQDRSVHLPAAERNWEKNRN